VDRWLQAQSSALRHHSCPALSARSQTDPGGSGGGTAGNRADCAARAHAVRVLAGAPQIARGPERVGRDGAGVVAMIMLPVSGREAQSRRGNPGSAYLPSSRQGRLLVLLDPSPPAIDGWFPGWSVTFARSTRGGPASASQTHLSIRRR
jgi:hypothetical protein